MSKQDAEDNWDCPKFYYYSWGDRVPEVEIERCDGIEPSEPDYSDWIMNDYWTLREAACIACGIDPGKHVYGPPQFDRVSELLGWAGRAVQARTLPQLTAETPGRFEGIFSTIERDNKTWVLPSAFLTWCVSKKFNLPEKLREMAGPYCTLPIDERVHGNSLLNEQRRTEMLGAALACLAKWPEECKDKNGKVVQEKLWHVINDKTLLIWKDKFNGEPPLKRQKTIELVREYFNRVGLGKKGK